MIGADLLVLLSDLLFHHLCYLRGRFGLHRRRPHAALLDGLHRASLHDSILRVIRQAVTDALLVLVVLRDDLRVGALAGARGSMFIRRWKSK